MNFSCNFKTYYPWIQAVRPLSYSYFVFSLTLGMAMYFESFKELHPINLCLTFFLGVFLQWYIVLANDFADYDSDLANKFPTRFSGGSRVLPEQKIKPDKIRAFSTYSAALALMTAVIISILVKSWGPTLLTATGITLLLVYSFEPFRLSYRGGGEVLQMIGLAIVLPIIGFQSQGGLQIPWGELLVLSPSQLGCAIATDFGDEPSDRLTEKKTIVVMFGKDHGRTMVIFLHSLSLFGLYKKEILNLDSIGFSILGLVVSTLVIFNQYRLIKPDNEKMPIKIFFGILPTPILVTCKIIHSLIIAGY